MNINKTRVLTVLILVSCCLSVPAAALANAGPVYMERYPGFGIAAMEDCPVRVEREELTFVIDENSTEDAVVTANYHLHNTAPEAITVPMLFPFVSEGRDGGGARIKFNGETVAYETYLAGSVEVRDYLEEPAAFKGQVDLDNIIQKLNESLYESRFFEDRGEAVLYEITFKPPAERQSSISFNLDPEKTRVISFGFTGFGLSAEGECIVSAYVRENDLNQRAYLLVLGEDTLTDLQAAYDDKVVKTSANVKDFLFTFLSDEHAYWNMEKRNMDNFYATFVKEIDRSFTEVKPVLSESLIMDNLFNRNNISVLLYEVKFAGDSQNELCLTYPMRATIDRRESRDYINTFAYILNPARNFKDFGKLDIRIELNDHSPYIIESSLPLQEAGRGIYTLSLDGLPDEDLVFSTYPKAEITFLDSTAARIIPQGYGGLFVRFGAAALLIVMAASAVFVFIKNKRKQ